MTTFGRRVIYMLMAFVALGIGLNTVGFQGNNCYLCSQSAVAQEANQNGSNTSANFSPVDIILQNPALPNGCEVTSLAMALTAAGYPIDHVSLYENYLPRQAMVTVGGERYSVSPEQYCVGDAVQAPGGWYCFEEPILRAGNDWLKDNESDMRMQRLSGIDREALIDLAKEGMPVIAWVTLGYERLNYLPDSAWTVPDGTTYIPYGNLHCVVIAGFENGFFRIADPLSGWRYVQKDTFWQSFEAIGQRAVTVQPA